MTRVRTIVVAIALLALAGCGLGNPWPAPPPPAPAPLTVAVFGDSVARGTGGALHDALTFDGQANTVTDYSVVGQGLLDPGVHTYINDRLPASGVVVFEYLGDCRGCLFPWGAPAFYAAWEASMRQVVADVRARELAIVWVRTPPIAHPFIASVAYYVSQVIDRVTSDLDVVTADWFAALGDVNGKYQEDLYYETFLAPAAAHRVRDTDGLHLVEEGRRRSAAWTAAAVIDAATP